MTQSLPASYKAVVLKSYTGVSGLSVEERPMPKLKSGQVLVKVHASPINPSDTLFIQGEYGFKKPLPAVPGFEGSGVVVASGGGFLANRLLGKPVICANQTEGDGVWAEYFVTSGLMAVPVQEGISLDQAATALVNPLTAWAIMDMAKKGKHRAIVHTAAASALGKMLVRLQARFGVKVINVVRREEQVAMLKALGAEYVLNSTAPDFDEQLKRVCDTYKTTLAFEAVTGELTGRVLSALSHGGRVKVYGTLSLEDCKVNPNDLIFQRKVVEGFWMSDWIAERNLIQTFLAFNSVQKFLKDELQSTVRARYSLEQFAEAIADYNANMTGGKVLIAPSS
jgi:NADPH:quinone reductase-like Zn-dependent oxidoreductase